MRRRGVRRRAHPLAADGGVVLNLEARGSTGPVIMFETSPEQRRRWSDVFGRAAPHPVGTSFAVEVYRLLPNDTDFTAFLDDGLRRAQRGLHRRRRDLPHAAGHAGRRWTGAACSTTATTRWRWPGRSARADLTRRCAPGDDATYFPVPGGLVRYPGWLTWPLAALALRRGAGAGLAGPAPRRRGQRRPAGRRLRAGPGADRRRAGARPAALGRRHRDPARLRRAARPVPAAALVPAGRAGARRRPCCSPGTRCCAAGSARPRWPSAGCGWLARARAGAGRPSRPAARTWPPCRRWPARSAASSRCSLRGWWSVLAVTLGAAVGVVILLPTVVLFFPALGMAMGGAGRALRGAARPGRAAGGRPAAPGGRRPARPGRRCAPAGWGALPASPRARGGGRARRGRPRAWTGSTPRTRSPPS